MEKKTLCIDARMVNSSGIGVYISELLMPLAGHYSLILLGDPAQLSKYSNIATIIPFLAPIYSLKEQYQLFKLVPKCDIFWSPHYNVPVLPVKAKYRVATIHDAYHLALALDLGRVKKLYARLIMRKALSLSKRVITVSNFSKNEIIHYTHGEAEKIQVIYNGVDQHPHVQAFEFLQPKYKLPEKYILFVGNVKPHKNLSALLESYLLLDNTITNKYKIVIVGKIDGFITGDEKIFELVNNNPVLKKNVQFTDYVDDDAISGIYKNASLFVFPSLYEGFGIPPLEAMSNHCAVAASDIESIKEICNSAVIYFNPYDKNNIAEQISLVLNDSELRLDLVKKGAERCQLFSWENSAQAHIKLFNELFS
jgi:glycosyltransferase involved in cell wall biosynthesis